MAQGSPAVARHRLRLALRRRREATGRTQGDIAKSLDWSLSKLQRIEAGENSISTTDLQALLGQLKVTDPAVISTLVADAKVARGRSRWDEPRYRDFLSPATKTLLDFEVVATEIRTFQTVVLPGLLQTPEFARTLFNSWKEELPELQREVQLEVRLERRARVLDRTDPPHYMFILDEAMLHRSIGGPRIYAAQLRHLVDEARAGHIDLRVAPFAVPSGITIQIPFTIVTMENAEDSIVYRENYEFDEIVQAPDRVQRHLALFDQLWEHSLTADATMNLMERQIAELLSLAERGSTRRTGQ